MPLNLPVGGPAIAIDPQARMAQAAQLGEEGKSEEAYALFDDVVVKDPANHVARLDRGTLLMQMGRYDEAIADYQAVIDAGPQEWRDRAIFGRGFCNLVKGNLKEGFRDYEHRKMLALPDAITTHPEWMGGRRFPKGETMLVVGEMGFGDNIMFSRYLPMLAEQGVNVIAAVPPPLAPLFRTIPSIQVHGQYSPPFSCWVRSMSLAHRFGTDIDTVPPPTKFELPMLDEWISIKAATGKFNVGLCWSGSRQSTYDKHRNVPLAMLAPLMDIPGVEFFSLQVDIRQEDEDAYNTFDNMWAMPNVANFMQTATIIRHLDLVITVDTSIAHLAGTLGVPTWVMLTAFRTYWKWIRGRDDSPWYPSAKCYRQRPEGKWDVVIERIEADLRAMIPPP